MNDIDLEDYGDYFYDEEVAKEFINNVGKQKEYEQRIGFISIGDYLSSYYNEHRQEYANKEGSNLFKMAKSNFICKKCNGKQFYVSTENYTTIIKCVTCKWELCVHSG